MINVYIHDKMVYWHTGNAVFTYKERELLLLRLRWHLIT